MQETEFMMKPGFAVTVYTDYINIMTRYSCNIINNVKQEYFYILTRNKNLRDPSKLFNVFDGLQKVPANLSNLQFNLINSLNC